MEKPVKTIRLELDLIAEIEKDAKNEDRSFSYIVEKILKQHYKKAGAKKKE